MTLTTRLAACLSALSLAFAAPAFACGVRLAPRAPQQAHAAERITGSVVAFRDLPSLAIEASTGAMGSVAVQYPRFERSGKMLYMTTVRVPAAQLRPLQRALAERMVDGSAQAQVVLEQTGDDTWRLVSWR